MSVEQAAQPKNVEDIPVSTPLVEIGVRHGVLFGVARRWVTSAGLPPLTPDDETGGRAGHDWRSPEPA